MHALRLLLITLVCVGLAYLLTREIVAGLKSGKIAYSRKRLYCHRSKNPLGFWLLVGLFSGIIVMSLAAWLWVVWPSVAS